MESGKALCWCQGTGKTEDGAPLEATGNSRLSGGQGKRKGMEGKGTSNCRLRGDEYSGEVNAESELPK
ncbi:MAG TPA: hypothetical protein VHM93_06040 [Candidatus Acidoferrum sp.]|jgi:hypothetical protein|nr:hypothetical protein [Candidatus Acidoferrum sp.]